MTNHKLESAFNLFINNLVIVVPHLAAVVITYVLSALAIVLVIPLVFAVILTAVMHGPLSAFFTFIIFGIIIATFSAFVSTIAMCIEAHMAERIVNGVTPSLEESWNAVISKAGDILVLAIILAVLTFLTSIIPVVGSAIARTLFLAAPIFLVIGKSSPIDSTVRSVEYMLRLINEDIAIPLVIFITYLVASLAKQAGLLITLVAEPYFVVLLTYTYLKTST